MKMNVPTLLLLLFFSQVAISNVVVVGCEKSKAAKYKDEQFGSCFNIVTVCKLAGWEVTTDDNNVYCNGNT